jgi:hypothetical protein
MTSPERPAHRYAPRDCPVCGERLALTRLGCDECGTELAGHFDACEFCSLPSDDREILRVFLRSRGNMKELERHLGVSYPTARARFDALLGRLGLDRPAPPASRLDLLESLASGEIDVDEALRRLA